MKNEKIPSEVFKTYSSMVEDYLNVRPEIQPFITRSFSLNSIGEQAASRKFSDESRVRLIEVLKEQYHKDGLEMGKVTSAQVDLLKEVNAFTVTSGHQLCLFTGPLYFVIKALHCIKLSDELNARFPSLHFIPVFWMATEDHDFEEINHIHLFGKSIHWNREGSGMVGDYSLDSFQHVVDELSEIMGDSMEAFELKALFNEAYLNSKTLSEASRKLIHALFGNRGLVVLDGNHAALKAQFRSVFKRELTESVLEKNVSETNARLSEKYKIQVNPRTVNIFYLGEGRRALIEKTAHGFALKDAEGSWTQEEMLSELDSHPERFSPNVILRPLYQEVVLPNLCYIGGPAEIAYWLELKTSFEALDVPFPLLNLRNSIMWLDKSKLKKLEKYQLSPLDLFLDESELTKKMTEFESIEMELEKDMKAIEGHFASISDHIQTVDPSLKPFVLAEGRKVEKQLEAMKSKLLKAQKSKNEGLISAYWNLHEKVFPGGNLHERYDNFVPYFLSYGWSFFDHIYEAIDPEDSRLILISES